MLLAGRQVPGVAGGARPHSTALRHAAAAAGVAGVAAAAAAVAAVADAVAVAAAAGPSA
jgi:hypothetical protein